MESGKIGLGLPCLRRRRTKKTIPITESMAAAAAPMIPPAISGVFDFVCDDRDVVVAVVAAVAVVPLGFMLSTGALRKVPTSQPPKKN